MLLPKVGDLVRMSMNYDNAIVLVVEDKPYFKTSGRVEHDLFRGYFLGDDYYPRAYTENWIGCFSTREEAENTIIKEPFEYKGKTLFRYKTNDTDYVDWYDIVDLEEWMNK